MPACTFSSFPAKIISSGMPKGQLWTAHNFCSFPSLTFFHCTENTVSLLLSTCIESYKEQLSLHNCFGRWKKKKHEGHTYHSTLLCRSCWRSWGWCHLQRSKWFSPVPETGWSGTWSWRDIKVLSWHNLSPIKNIVHQTKNNLWKVTETMLFCWMLNVLCFNIIFPSLVVCPFWLFWSLLKNTSPVRYLIPVELLFVPVRPRLVLLFSSCQDLWNNCLYLSGQELYTFCTCQAKTCGTTFCACQARNYFLYLSDQELCTFCTCQARNYFFYLSGQKLLSVPVRPGLEARVPGAEDDVANGDEATHDDADHEPVRQDPYIREYNMYTHVDSKHVTGKRWTFAKRFRVPASGNRTFLACWFRERARLN